MRPEANPTETESGLALVEHRKPETMGTVVAVGFCMHPLKVEATAIADELDAWNADLADNPQDYSSSTVREAAKLLRRATAREPLVKAGDTVIFSWTAGREVFLDDSGERYLMLTEDDLLAVVEW